MRRIQGCVRSNAACDEIPQAVSSTNLRMNCCGVAVGELQDEGILPAELLVRTNRYLNDVIEQDHRRVKQRVRPMLGFKHFDHATITITGIELVHQITKEQFDVSALCLPHARTPEIWEAVLTA
jgi:transposase-like protein